MVQSVESLLAGDADRQVRAVWQRLLDAGLPSQARQTAASNRPHVTLVALPEISPAAEERLPQTVAPWLPAGATWGPVHCFGRSPWVLVRLVEPSGDLRALHAAVARVCEVPPGHLSSPQRWTPHVTLARRVPEAVVGAALESATSVAEEHAPSGSPLQLTAVRRWDGTGRREWLVGDAATQA